MAGLYCTTSAPTAVAELLDRTDTPTPVETFDDLCQIVWSGLSKLTRLL